MRAHCRRQAAQGRKWTGGLSTENALRRKTDSVRAAPMISSRRGGGRRGQGGPGARPDGEWPRWARILRMTAGSCSVAISRRRPQLWGPSGWRRYRQHAGERPRTGQPLFVLTVRVAYGSADRNSHPALEYIKERMDRGQESAYKFETTACKTQASVTLSLTQSKTTTCS